MCLAVNSVEIDRLEYALVQVAELQFGIVIVGIDVMLETGSHLGEKGIVAASNRFANFVHSLVDNVVVMFESFGFVETVSAVAKVPLFVDSFERRNTAELQQVQLAVPMVQVEVQPLVLLEGQ